MDKNLAYSQMKRFILNGEVSQPLDFYGLLLHCYDLEDNEKSQKASVIAMDYADEKNGYLDGLEMFHKLVDLIK